MIHGISAVTRCSRLPRFVESLPPRFSLVHGPHLQHRSMAAALS